MSTWLLRHDADHLRGLCILDAVCFAQGLMRIVVQVSSQPHRHAVVASAPLALIGLRLLSSPEALSAYLLACRVAGQPACPTAVTLWHSPVLLMPAWPLFLTCSQRKFSGPEGPGASIVWSAIATLVINTVWLSAQLLGAATAGIHFQESRGPRPLCWMINNVVCVVLTEAALRCVPRGGVLIALVLWVVNSLVALFGAAAIVRSSR